MIREKREYCRAVIAKEGFTVFHPACDEPWLDEEVEILYEDMDGNPCRGTAKMVSDNFVRWYQGMSPECIKGNRMVNLIAWKRIGQKEPVYGKLIDAYDLGFRLRFDCNAFRSLSKKKQNEIMEFIINQPEVYRNR